MTIDPRIPLMVEQRDVLADMNSLAALAARKQETEMRAQQLQKQKTLADLLPQAMQGNQQAMQQVASVDPETYFKIKSHFAGLDKARRETEAAKWTAAGPVLAQMKTVPQEQRMAFLQSAAPALLAQGWTMQELSQLDPSDQSIDALTATQRAVADVLKSQEPEVFDVQPGAARYERNRQTGELRTIVAPNSGDQPFGIRGVPQGAIDMLRGNPSLAADFDAKYGAGAAAKVLGGSVGNGAGGF